MLLLLMMMMHTGRIVSRDVDFVLSRRRRRLCVLAPSVTAALPVRRSLHISAYPCLSVCLSHT